MKGANLSAEEAAAAVAAVLRFLTARLPSSMAGQLHAWLDDPSRRNGSPGAGGRTKP